MLYEPCHVYVRTCCTCVSHDMYMSAYMQVQCHSQVQDCLLLILFACGSGHVHGEFRVSEDPRQAVNDITMSQYLVPICTCTVLFYPSMSKLMPQGPS